MAKSLFSCFTSILFGENSDDDERKEPDIPRIAIDQSGHLGSLYDVYQDTIVEQHGMDLTSESFKLNDPIICRLHKDRISETENLLKIVDIDCSLRVSIILKIIQPSGIALNINYPGPIDKHTRFLYFYQTTLHESCHDNLVKRQRQQRLPTLVGSATHIITEIVWGIHAIVVLQLPPDQHDEIDNLLELIRYTLTDTQCHVEMTREEEALLDQIISMRVYSNIPSLIEITKLYNVWQRLLQMRDNCIEHRPLKYMLSSIQSFYPDYHINNVTNTETYKYNIRQLDYYLFQQLSDMEALKFRLNNELPELLQGKLEEQLNNFQQDFQKITELYENDISTIRDSVLRMRRGEVVLYSIDQLVGPHAHIKLKDSIQHLSNALDELSLKSCLIKRLQYDEFEYYNVAKLQIEQDCNEQLLKDIFFKDATNKLIFCSHDRLKEQFRENWTDLYSQMITKHQENPHLNLVYADFTYSKFPLENMMILSSREQKIDKYNESNSQTTTSYLENDDSPSSLSLTRSEYINILLLGESGVGKSTFINAFANYLQFNSLEEAESGKPTVIIPVSFLMTINDNFDEELIQFGEPDPNENHNDSGQSVTQQCRSYVFEISSGKKLRIIDTPGFADTRGDNQDEMNMKKIFSFINNLTYLNGVCLLFKPNVARLNPYLFSCFTQLFRYFNENIRDHLIFCFTNTRSTFFAPGDTRPLLQSFFKSFSVKNIPLEKKNTFCFDSESFRYLVALQKSLQFNDIEKKEFEKSWIRSVKESQRLRDFLCDKLQPYRKNIEWQSIQDAHFQISFMIRPMLEAIRNILRNIILYETNSSIKLSASYLNHPTMICYKCDRTPKILNEFWILPDHIHNSTNKSNCTSNEQCPTEYRLDYECVNNLINESKDILNQQRIFLYETCIKFACFLLTTQARQDDPFLSGFIRMIDEEVSISQQQKQSNYNKQLAIELGILIKDYEQLFHETQLSGENKILSKIYELIILVNEIPMIKEQINAIRKYQDFLLTSNEHDINIENTFL